jgi:hypothetical protein
VALTSATTDVITNQLPYTLGTWNHHVTDVTPGAVTWTSSGGGVTSFSTTAVNLLSAADQPADCVVLGYVKMEASAINATADAYFDDYVLKVATPHCPAADFVYRNSLIDSGRLNGGTLPRQSFVMFPAREMGQNNHSQQLNSTSAPRASITTPVRIRCPTTPSCAPPRT